MSAGAARGGPAAPALLPDPWDESKIAAKAGERSSQKKAR